MNLESLRIENYRNIQKLDFFPTKGVNIIYGDNAQGKTNLLEAIWLFCGGGSFRGARQSEYIAFGGESAQLEMEFSAGGRTRKALLRFLPEKKRVELGGVVLASQGELRGEFCAVVFSPDHLFLVKQGPQFRRRLIDTSLCQAYPKYAGYLERYGKALRQRSTLLRDIHHHPALLDTLEAWDKHILDYGSYITLLRQRYVHKLAEAAGAIYSGISSGKEALSLGYLPSFGELPREAGREECRAAMKKALLEGRREDIRRGVTLVGPHRDDVDIRVGGVSARLYGSQGQQRSCVLALKLAECAILEEQTGEAPVVLLDDVMSELDEGRRGYLLNRLEGRQVFITCCDTAAFQGLSGGGAYHIRGGSLVDG